MQRLMLAAVAVTAALVRVVPLLRGGGLLFYGRYDDGVYYTAAAALLDGRVPYRDFVLLHPPLITLALLPFALLGRLTSDPVGLLAARVTWMALGVLTAVLVARFAGRWGVLTGLAAGLLYACSLTAVYGDQATFLEPLADLVVLVAVVLLSLERFRGPPEIVAGVLLGLATATKIWYVVPAGLAVLLLLAHRRWGAALRVTLGGVGAGVVVVLPFFLLAPGDLWRQVVTEQIGRPPMTGTGLDWRLSLVFGGRGQVDSGAPMLLVVVCTVAGVVGIAACLWHRDARLVGLVCLGEAVTLLLTPSMFKHYGHFTAATLAVVTAVGWTLLARWLLAPAALRRGLAIAAMVAIAGAGAHIALTPSGRAFPTAAVKAHLSPGCISADDPAALILLDRLSSDLRAGCPMPVDVTGHSYDSTVARRANAGFQRWLVGYLRSGHEAILIRMAHDSPVRGSFARIGPMVYRAPHVRVIRVTPGP